jgi:plastocyanin domain-containing protein
MSRLLVLALGLVLAVSCDKGTSDAKPKAKEAPVTAGTVTNGVRKIDVEAGKSGYVPERIVGKPGEKLVLVFKRTVEGECLAELKTPDGKLVQLPMNQTVEVPITVPTSGELAFACGMDMFKGVIVAQPAS